MVRTLALCQNAVIHANDTRPCSLMLSDTHHGDSSRLLYVYKRWILTIFTIKGDGSGSYLLEKNVNSASGGSGKTRAAKFSVALQYLVLEGIINEREQ